MKISFTLPARALFTALATALLAQTALAGYTFEDVAGAGGTYSKWTQEKAPNKIGTGIDNGSWNNGSAARWLDSSSKLAEAEQLTGVNLNRKSTKWTSGKIWDNGFLVENNPNPDMTKLVAIKVTFNTDHMAKVYREFGAPTDPKPVHFIGYDAQGNVGQLLTVDSPSYVDQMPSNDKLSSLTWIVELDECFAMEGIFFDDDPFNNSNKAWGLTCGNGINMIEIATVCIPEPGTVIALIAFGALGLTAWRARRKSNK